MTAHIIDSANKFIHKVDTTFFVPLLQRFALQQIFLDGITPPTLNNIPRYPAIESAITTGQNDWTIAAEKARLLAHLVIHFNLQNIVEFGAGLSSVILAQALAQASGGHLTSVEQMPEWCSNLWMKVIETPGVDAQMIQSSPQLQVTSNGCYFAYRSGMPALADRGPYDMVLIDAPQGSYGRDGALHILHPYIKPNAIIVLDDAGRPREQWTLARWLRIYPGLKLVTFAPEFANTGLAILVHDGNRRTRQSISSALSSTMNVIRYESRCALRRASSRQHS